MVKPQKKHFASLTVLLSAAALVIIGSVMAYFTSTDQTTNKFEGSRFDIFLTETKWDAEKGKSVVPGDELEKNPQVTNKERTDGYIFLRVTVPCDTQMVDNDDGTKKGVISGDSPIPMYKFMVDNGDGTYAVNQEFSAAQAVNSHWQLVAENGGLYTAYKQDEKQLVYVYAYAQNDALTPLHRNEITEPVFDKLQLWNFNEQFDPDQNHAVRVEALGIQTDLPGHDASDIAGIWQLLEQEGS